jgi:hypothetical protein
MEVDVMSDRRSMSLLSGAICLLGLLGCDAGPVGTDDQEVSSVQQGYVQYWLGRHGGDAGSFFQSTFSMKINTARMKCGTYVDWLALRGEQYFVMGPYGGYWDGTLRDVSCGPNELVVGIKGKSGSWVDQLTFICKRADGSTYDLSTCGTSTGGSYFEDRCPSGTTMVGVAGKESEYGIEAIQIGCGYSDFSH